MKRELTAEEEEEKEIRKWMADCETMHRRLKVALACKNNLGGKGRLSLNQITLVAEESKSYSRKEAEQNDLGDIVTLMVFRNLKEAVLNFGMTKVTWDGKDLKVAPSGFKMSEAD